MPSFSAQSSVADPLVSSGAPNNLLPREGVVQFRAMEKLFSIPESDFYPGHFSRDILIFEELLRNEQVKEAINERPEKYRLLIETKAEIKNN